MNDCAEDNMPDKSQHWEAIIAAIRGSPIAQVWWEFKHPVTHQTNARPILSSVDSMIEKSPFATVWVGKQPQ